MFRFILISLSLTLTILSESKAQEEKLEASDELIITSRHLDYDYENRRAVFHREVKAINGDTILTSEKMTSFFDKENQPYLLIAEEDVFINRGQQQAKAHKATYEINQKKIILRGQPELFDGKNTIKGRVITFFEESRITEVLDPEVIFKVDKSKLTKEENAKP